MSNQMKPPSNAQERAETQRMLGKLSEADKYTNGSLQGTNFQNMDCQLQQLDVQMKDLRNAVERIEMRVDEDFEKRQEKTLHNKQWKFLALVLDRFFFMLYFLLIVVSVSALFPRT